MNLWKIETTGKPAVFHLAPEGTQEPLCGAQHSRGTVWRTPPKLIRGDRLCTNCVKVAGLRVLDWQAANNG